MTEYDATTIIACFDGMNYANNRGDEKEYFDECKKEALYIIEQYTKKNDENPLYYFYVIQDVYKAIIRKQKRQFNAVNIHYAMWKYMCDLGL